MSLNSCLVIPVSVRHTRGDYNQLVRQHLIAIIGYLYRQLTVENIVELVEIVNVPAGSRAISQQIESDGIPKAAVI